MRMFCMALALVAMSSLATAQLPSGDHNGLWIGMFNTAAGTNAVLQLDTTLNSQTTFPFLTAPASPWQYWGNPFGAAQAPNNQDLYVPCIVDTAATQIAVAEWNPVLTASGPTGAINTIWAGPLTGGPIANWADWECDSDGEVVTLDNSGPSSTPPGPQTAAFLAGGTFTTTNLPTNVRNEAGIGMTTWNRIRGGWEHCSWGQSGTIGTEVYHSPYDFSTAMVRNTSSVFNTRYGGDMVQNEDVYLSTCCSQVFLYAPGGGAMQSINLGPAAASNVAYDLTAEHFAKPGIGLWATIWNAPRGIQHIDVTNYPTGAAVITQTFTGNAISMPSSPIEVMPLFENDLNTQRTGNRSWVANINPNPLAQNQTPNPYANKGYVLGASLSGAQQITLGSLRELFITPDFLTIATVGGGFPPFFQNTAGTTTALGTATVKMDMSTLGLGANGIVVNLAAVILDPAAPDGILHVCQPYAWVLDNK